MSHQFFDTQLQMETMPAPAFPVTTFGLDPRLLSMYNNTRFREASVESSDDERHSNGIAALDSILDGNALNQVVVAPPAMIQAAQIDGQTVYLTDWSPQGPHSRTMSAEEKIQAASTLSALTMSSVQSDDEYDSESDVKPTKRSKKNSKAKATSPKTDGERKQSRRERNREAAKRSRAKRANQFSQLLDENDQLKAQIELLLKENSRLKSRLNA